jgi:hypothetical protein
MGKDEKRAVSDVQSISWREMLVHNGHVCEQTHLYHNGNYSNEAVTLGSFIELTFRMKLRTGRSSLSDLQLAKMNHLSIVHH